MNATSFKPLTQPVRVGYVLKMFPRLSETFILNEVLELEQQGLSLHIFSLKRPVDAVFHAQTKSVRSHPRNSAPTLPRCVTKHCIGRRQWRNCARIQTY